MRITLPRALVALLTAAAGATGVASAADPATGTVSAASPTVQWSGQVTLPYLSYLQMLVNEGSADTPCDAPTCDRFTLEVKDGPAELAVEQTATSPDGGFETMRIIDPDGKVTYAFDQEDTPQKMKLKAAKNGTYFIDITNGSKTQVEYTAKATLGGAPPAGGTPPGHVVDPPPPVGGPQQPGDRSRPLTVTAKAPKLSARRLAKARRASFSVTTNRDAAVKVTLLKGRRSVGSASARVNGTKKVTLRLKRRIKRGTYNLLLVANDGKSEVRRSVRVKVGR